MRVFTRAGSVGEWRAIQVEPEAEIPLFVGRLDLGADSEIRWNRPATALPVGECTLCRPGVEKGRSSSAWHYNRPIADLHTHILMRKRESLPSRNQVEPYKASFELLLHEVIVNAG